VRDPAGNTLASGVRDGGDSTIDDFTLPGKGLYTLEVRRPGDAQRTYSPYLLNLALTGTLGQVPSEGGTLALDRAVTGLFAEVPATHAWIFQGEAGQDVSLSVARLTGPLAVSLTLLGPDGSTVFTSASQAGAANTLSTGPLSLPLGGTYTVLVTGDSSALGATYRLLVQSSTLLEEASRELVPLRDEVGTITDLQPQGMWTLEAEAGETLSLRAIALSGSLRPTLMLWGPDGRPLMEGIQETSALGKQASIPAAVAPQSGTYQVVVSREGGAAGASVGSYRLMFRRQRLSSRAAAAVDVALGEPVTGALDTPDPKLYAFQAAGGDVIGVSVRVMEGDTVPDLSLETEQGMPVDVPIVTSQDEATISAFVLPKDERYVLVLEGQGPIQYVLTVFRRTRGLEPGGFVRNLGRGRLFSEAIVDPAQPTRWIFTGNAGEVLAFAVDTTGGTLRADMTLYGPQGYIASATEQPGSRRTVLGPLRLPDDGDYALLVGPWLGMTGGSRGGYTIRADPAEPGTSGSEGGYVRVRGQAVSGGLIPEDAEDIWTFDGQAGEIVTIRAEQTYGNGSIQLELSSADGSSLATSEPGSGYVGAEIVSFVLPDAERYQVTVEGVPGDEGHIEYRLWILQTQSPIVASMRTARGIAYGQPQDGAIASSQGYQAWVFFGQAGERVRGAVHPAGTSFSPSVYLIGPEGHILVANATAVAGTDVTLPDFTLPGDGFYGLVVGSANSDQLSGEAGYTVLVEREAAGARDQGVLGGDASRTLTEAASVHQWTLEPAYSGDFEVQVQATAPGKRLDLFVLSATGDVLAKGVPGELDETIAILRLTAGELYTAVVSGGPVPGQVRYTLRMIPASVVASGMAIAVDAPNVGRITDEHFADEWQMQGRAGESVAIRVARVSGDLIPLIAVLDESGAAIQQATAGSDGTLKLSVQLPVDGTYHVLVSRFDNAVGATSGDYTIAVSPG
jgi:hypothetical protein